MAGYSIIRDVGTTLIELMRLRMKGDGDIADALETEQGIILDSPASVEGEDSSVDKKLSIFLYRVVEDPHLKNRAYVARSDEVLVPPPLALDLFYLITPLTGSREKDHLVLGKVLQILYDNAVIQPTDIIPGLQAPIEELRLILNPISVEDLSKIWSAFMKPYRLSVSLEVKVVGVDSQRERGARRVRQKELAITRSMSRESD